MMLMSATKKRFSASEIQRQVGYKRYDTIWNIVHKLRTVMGKGEDLYKLQDIIELDEGHFEVETSKKVKGKLKRGKGSQRQKQVVVMAESTPLEDIKKIKNRVMFVTLK